MRNWVRNQIDWHIRPSLKSLFAWFSKTRNRSRIQGRDNQVGFRYTTGKSSVEISGHRNSVFCGPGVVLGSINISINGNGSTIRLGQFSRFDNLSIYVYGDNCLLEVGERTFISGATMVLDEAETRIQISSGCMFGSGIEIRTGDSHGIFDLVTRERLNPAASVSFGNRVWLGSGVKVMKGSTVADECIVGAGSIVTKPLGPRSSLFVGSPARFVRGGVTWSWHRDRFPDRTNFLESSNGLP